MGADDRREAPAVHERDATQINQKTTDVRLVDVGKPTIEFLRGLEIEFPIESQRNALSVRDQLDRQSPRFDDARDIVRGEPCAVFRLRCNPILYQTSPQQR